MLPALQIRQFVILSLPAQAGEAKDLMHSASAAQNLVSLLLGGPGA